MKMTPVHIIGGGLTGLTLGLCLKQKGIAAIIYDRATSAPRYNYGISLHSSTYRPLLGMLQMEEAAFREKLAVNAQQGGTGGLSGTDTFRCNRGRLEALLGNGLSIRWNKRLKDVQITSQPQELIAHFDDGSSIRTTCLVGCDGPHSMTRQSLNPRKLDVLPYVVFNGRRRIQSSQHAENLHKYLRDSVHIEKRKRDVLLQISINNISDSSVDLSYTYSRPAYNLSDPLYRPDRPINSATDIPEKLFQELEALRDLEAPFDDIFNAEKVRHDRILNWLMRSLEPELEETKRLADHGVIFIGDAAHATPILGGEGANMAIRDGIDLAEHIAAHGVTNFKDFSESKYTEWKHAVDDSKRRIKDMHSSEKSSL